MKLLFENWRKYLNEEIMALESWPSGYKIEITKDPKFYGDTAYSIELYRDYIRQDKKKSQLAAGWLNVDFVNVGSDNDRWLDDCNYEIFDNLYTLHVGVNDNEPRGFGPFLMDLGLELAHKDNKWIIPARLVGGSGNEAAERIYDFYLDKRKEDVETIDINLDCWEEYVDSRVPDDTPESFLYLYRKKPTIINSELAKEVIKFT
jgi:hypothetical protein